MVLVYIEYSSLPENSKGSILTMAHVEVSQVYTEKWLLDELKLKKKNEGAIVVEQIGTSEY